SFHFGHNHVVDVAYGLAIEVLKIVFHRLLHTAAQRLGGGCRRNAIGCWGLCGNHGLCCVHATLSSVSCSCSKNFETLWYCSCALSIRFNCRRNDSLAGTVCKYQTRCLRAIRGPITSP